MKLLAEGEILFSGEVLAGSNSTFSVDVCGVKLATRAVYKPRIGETPLWDFPTGTLYKREYAAYLLSLLLGWDLIPPTVIRDGPLGVGVVQLYVEHDPLNNFFTLRNSHMDHFKAIACFDLVANNADRKASHCLLDSNGRVWSIDHGLTFHSKNKMRTVISDYSNEFIPVELLDSLGYLNEKLNNPTGRVNDFVCLLNGSEIVALTQRIEMVLEMKVYPDLNSYMIPWPPV